MKFYNKSDIPLSHMFNLYLIKPKQYTKRHRKQKRYKILMMKSVKMNRNHYWLVGVMVPASTPPLAIVTSPSTEIQGNESNFIEDRLEASTKAIQLVTN